MTDSVPRLPESAVHDSARADIAAGNGTFEQHNEWLTRSGYAPLLSSSGSSAPTGPLASPTAAPAGRGRFGPQGEIHAQARQMLAAGHGDLRQVNAALAADGYEPLPALAASDEVKAVAAQIDADFPPAKPADFDLTGVFTADHAAFGDNLNPDALAADAQTREWMATARLPKAIGSAIAQEAARFAPEWQKMDDNAREIHARTVMAQLRQMHGERAGERVALARLVVDAVAAKHPAIVAFLERSGAASNLYVISQLAEHGARLAARKGLSIEAVKRDFADLATLG